MDTRGSCSPGNQDSLHEKVTSNRTTEGYLEWQGAGPRGQSLSDGEQRARENMR
jgi:hypothetical protein